MDYLELIGYYSAPDDAVTPDNIANDMAVALLYVLKCEYCE